MKDIQKDLLLFVVGQLLVKIKQWGETCIDDGTYTVKTKLPIDWKGWGLVCLCTIAGTNDLKSTVVWDDKAIDKASGEVVFRCADYQSNGGLWIIYLYIGS